MPRIKKLLVGLAAASALVICEPSWGRGFGGGHFGGGGFGGGFHGGGMGGFHGGGFGGGGFHGGGLGRGGFNPGRMGQFHPGGMNLGGLPRSGFNPGGFNRAISPSRISSLRPGSFTGAGGRPTRAGLNQFLGLPSDAGLHHLSGQTQSRLSQFLDNNRGADGQLRNLLPGETQSRLSQLADKVRAGDGPGKNLIPGETQSRLSQLYDKARAGDRPGNKILPGEEQSRLSQLYDKYRTGNHPLRPVSPWRWHNNAVIIRNNFNNYYFFTPGWYRRYPGAWYPAAWAYGDAWAYASWASLAAWLEFSAAQPIYYDYGTNIVDQNDTVYFNGQDEGTAAQYYAQAQTLAKTDGDQQVAKDEKWMPLGVFALSDGTQTKATMIMQLAVNKQGIIRGNYTNTATDKTTPIQGAVDKKTERAAWTLGDEQGTVVETGLYNLTKNEAPALVHAGKDETEQMVLVRLDQKNQPAASQDAEP